jgi:cell division protein FtsA
VTSAQNLVKCVNRAGFKVDTIILESLASSRAVLTNDEKELGVVHIDLGGGTTDVIVHLDGAPYYTSVVPIGGQQVTGDVSIMLKTPLESAERIKRQAGCCYMELVEDNEPVIIPGVGGRPPLTIERRNLCSIIQPRMAEIMTMVRDKIQKKGLLKSLGGGVVLTGGGALMPGAVDLAQDIFGMAARIGRPVAAQGLSERFRAPEYATGVGLVIMGAQEVEAEAGEPAPREKSGMLDSIGKWFRNFFE